MSLLDKFVIERYARTCAARAGLGVVFDSPAPYHDGKAIHLPPITNKTTHEQVVEMLYMVAHEVGHDLWSSFDLLHKKKPTEVLKNMWNMLEDHRIDALTANMYAGDKAYCDEINTIRHADVRGKIATHMPDLLEAYDWESAVRADFSPRLSTVADMPALDGKLAEFTPRLRAIREIEDRETGTLATYQLALDIFKALDNEQPDEEQDGEGQDGKGDPSEGEGSGKGKGKGAASDDKGDGEGDPSEDDGVITGTGRCPRGTVKRTARVSDFDDLHERGTYVPTPLNDIDVVTFTGATATSSQGNKHYAYPVPWLKENMAKLEFGVSNGFANKVRSLLQILSRVRTQYAQKRGKLHGRSLHRLSVKDGGGYSERVFTNKTNALSLDVSVALLVDYSGSMGGDKLAHAVKSAMLLSDVLGNVMHIPTAVYGFTSYDDRNGDEQLSMAEFRTFTDKTVSDEVMLTRMSIYANNMANNADGEAVNYVYNDLRTQATKRKLLIVLSDGEPSACPKFGGSVSGHTTAVCDAIQRKGDVEMFGIGILSAAVKRFYKDHIVLADASALEVALLKVLQTLLINRA